MRTHYRLIYSAHNGDEATQKKYSMPATGYNFLRPQHLRSRDGAELSRLTYIVI